MKLVAISDTHTQAARFTIPPCDVLVHAGDFTYGGEFSEVNEFVQWLRQQPAKHKVVIAGNHDYTFDNTHKSFNTACRNLLANCPDDSIHYLENASVVINGIKFYGTPWTPWFYDWGFNGLEGADAPFKRGLLLDDIYGEIPEDTNVLICHGPPYGIVDRATSDHRCGSMVMRSILESDKLPLLYLYLCGHIHEARGHEIACGGVHICNVSSLQRDYRTTNPPIVIELDEDGGVNSIQGYE